MTGAERMPGSGLARRSSASPHVASTLSVSTFPLFRNCPIKSPTVTRVNNARVPAKRSKTARRNFASAPS